MFIALDSLLVVLTILSLTMALKKRWAVRRQVGGSGQSGDWSALVGFMLHHNLIWKKRWTGLFHLILVWGFFLFLFIVILDQVDGYVVGMPPGIISLILDVTGVMMLISTVFFLIRRTTRDHYQESGKTSRRIVLPLVLLLLILLSGFLAEGIRLAIITDVPAWKAPIGTLISGILPASPLFMQIMIRLHIYLVLIFVATLPYTFMRHAASGALGILGRRETGSVPVPRLLSAKNLGADGPVERISDSLLLGVEACVACGSCVDNCPASISGKPLLPGNMMQDVLGRIEQNHFQTPSLADLESAMPPEVVWNCTQCMACVTHCPVSARPMDLISHMRRQSVLGKGNLPEEAWPMIRNLELYGDVMGKGIAHRTDWLMDETLPKAGEAVDDERWLLWVGCSGAFHPRYSETVRAFVKVLKAGGVAIDILGNAELCCGEPARRLGGETLFRELAEKNIEQLTNASVTNIVTSCPHCFQTLKNEYPDLGGEFRVQHAVEMVWDLIDKGRIELKYPLPDQEITIHDPCYLGRANGIYKPLRQISEAIPGSRLSELSRSRQNGLCCGGGGGRMWLHENEGSNINQLRAKEIQDSGADVVATACPFCLVMMEDGISSLESEQPPLAMDIIDLVAKALK